MEQLIPSSRNPVMRLVRWVEQRVERGRVYKYLIIRASHGMRNRADDIHMVQ